MTLESNVIRKTQILGDTHTHTQKQKLENWKNQVLVGG